MKILKYGDPLLTVPAKLVTPQTLPIVVEAYPQMVALCRRKKREGAGLAATQVGILLSFFVTNIDNESEVIINPRIEALSDDKVTFREGCLSFSDKIRYEIERHARIKVIFQDISLNYKEREVTGFEAILYQHELDHLFGITMYDRFNQKNLTIPTQTSDITPNTPV